MKRKELNRSETKRICHFLWISPNPKMRSTYEHRNSLLGHQQPIQTVSVCKSINNHHLLSPQTTVKGHFVDADPPFNVIDFSSGVRGRGCIDWRKCLTQCRDDQIQTNQWHLRPARIYYPYLLGIKQPAVRHLVTFSPHSKGKAWGGWRYALLAGHVCIQVGPLAWAPNPVFTSLLGSCQVAREMCLWWVKVNDAHTALKREMSW